MKKRKRPQEAISAQEQAFLKGSEPGKGRPSVGEKWPISFRLDPELVDRVRVAAVLSRTTISDLLTQALEILLAKMEKERGEAFPLPSNRRKRA